MSKPTKVDLSRRRVLAGITTAVGLTGAAAGAVPFVASMRPSAAARAAGAPVQVNLGKIEEGQQVTVEWRGSPVWVLHRSAEMLERLSDANLHERLRDPQSRVKTQQPAYARNAFRSIDPRYLVVVANCTHLGCVPVFRPQPSAADLGADWPGGYFCPCHGSRFDLAGRVYKGVPAPSNLVVPAHRLIGDALVQVGVERESRDELA